jgi:uncharacterized protein YhfF
MKPTRLLAACAFLSVAAPALAFAQQNTAPAERAKPLVVTFWESCQSSLKPPPADGYYRVRRVGVSESAVNSILPLVLSGEKQQTTTTPRLYEGKRGETPVEGGYSVMVDWAGKPVAVLKTTKVWTKKFSDVSAEDSKLEGKPVRPLEAWRRVHVDFFNRTLAPYNEGWRADMPVTFERFEVVCTAKG